MNLPRPDVVGPPGNPSPPTRVVSPPKRAIVSPPKRATVSPPKRETVSPPKQTVQLQPVRTESAFPPKKDLVDVASPPVSTFKLARVNSKPEEPKPLPKTIARQPSLEREPPKPEKQPSPPIAQLERKVRENSVESNKVEVEKNDKIEKDKAAGNEESNGVCDKIKKFEKAAEDATATLGRMSRPGSVRGRSRTERIGSDSKDDLPPPATPFKDTVHFELTNPAPVERTPTVAERAATVAERAAIVAERAAIVAERQQTLTRNSAKWQRAEVPGDAEKPRPEPQRIIKPEFKPMASPVDVTIRSPSLGAKAPDQFPSHGTAFRNVASPDPPRPPPTADDAKLAGKPKGKEKYSVSKGSSYFTRGSEEIWLVKKKDIEEIEERVLDSFRRAGGGRPEAGAATLGRGKRAAYARSESLDPAWPGPRAHTLKRQASVACTCGHDRKPQPRKHSPAPAAASASAPAPAHAPAHADGPRPRSRSHGDDQPQHVLDKYETLV